MASTDTHQSTMRLATEVSQAETKPNLGGDNDRIGAIGRSWCDDIVMLAFALNVQPSN
jgi:hypothetical protein